MSPSNDPRATALRRHAPRWLLGSLMLGSLAIGAYGWTARAPADAHGVERPREEFEAFTDRLAAGDRLALIELAGRLASESPDAQARIAADEFVVGARDLSSKELAVWIVTHYEMIEFAGLRGRFALRRPEPEVDLSIDQPPSRPKRL